jgi:hypothetical protein
MAIRVGLPGGVRARVFVPRWGRSVAVTLDGAVVSTSTARARVLLTVGCC